METIEAEEVFRLASDAILKMRDSNSGCFTKNLKDVIKEIENVDAKHKLSKNFIIDVIKKIEEEVKNIKYSLEYCLEDNNKKYLNDQEKDDLLSKYRISFAENPPLQLLIAMYQSIQT